MLTNSTVMLCIFRARPLRAALKIGYLRPRCMTPTKHCGRDEQRHRHAAVGERGHDERQRRVGVLVRQQQRRRAAAAKAAAALASPAAGPRGSGGPWPLAAGGRSRGPPAVGCGRPGRQRFSAQWRRGGGQQLARLRGAVLHAVHRAGHGTGGGGQSPRPPKPPKPLPPKATPPWPTSRASPTTRPSTASMAP